ncbi:MAG: tripartite tricarboxylate transporter TctB family protein [Burkholderiales bacterium]
MSMPRDGARDLATGLVCLATSVGLFALTLDLPGPSLLVPIGPGFYPRIVLGLTAVLSALLVGQALLARRRATRSSGSVPDHPNYAPVLLTFAVFGIYVALLPLLGFRITTFAFVLALQCMLDQPANAKDWMVALVIALVTAFATFHVFQDYLSVLLPRGRWTDF